VVVGVGCGWWIEHDRSERQAIELAKEKERAKVFYDLYESESRRSNAIKELLKPLAKVPNPNAL
jgi:hypothetical protein